MAVVTRKQRDDVDVAVAKSQSATNLFQRAADELEAANDLLDQVIAAENAEIARRTERIAFAREQSTANKAVATKLAEFVV